MAGSPWNQSRDNVNDLAKLKRKLADFRPSELTLNGARRAAVAAVLRERNGLAELFFIRRSEHADDPWSGHMAFPGGRVDKHDRDGLAAAHRETLEETGINLNESSSYLGRLSDLQASGRGRKLALVIEPHVFHLLEPVTITLDEREVQEAFFVPLAYLSDPSNRGTLRWKKIVPLPTIRFGEREIWGLTLRMLDELLSLLDEDTSGLRKPGG